MYGEKITRCITLCLVLFIIAIAATAQATAKPTTADHGPRFAYLASYSPTKFVYQYRVEPSGRITPLQPPKISAGSHTNSLIATPSGQYVYVANGKNGLVAQCKVSRTGQLIPLNPPAVPGAIGNPEPVMTPNGRFLYFLGKPPANIKYNDLATGTAIVGFRVASNGTLHPIPSDTILLRDFAEEAAIDPKSRFLYVLNADRFGTPIGYNPYILQYRILPNGKLQPLNPSIVRDNLGPEARAMAVDTRDRMLFISYQSGTEGYKIGADGKLTFMPEATKENGLGFARMLYDDKHHVLCGTVIRYESYYLFPFLSVYHLKSGGRLGDQEVCRMSSSGALTSDTNDTAPDPKCHLEALTLDAAHSRLYAYDEMQSLMFVMNLDRDGSLPSRAMRYNPGVEILGVGPATQNLILL